MNLKRSFVAVPAALLFLGNGVANANRPSMKRALSPA